MIENITQFQSELSQYVIMDVRNYWPIWLTLAGLALVGMLGIFALHFTLRSALAKKTPASHQEKIYLYSKAVRLWHWSNAVLFILLLFSGLTNHFGLLSVSGTATLVSLHKVCGYLLIACWVLFLGVNLFGGNGRHYIINFKGLVGRIAKQIQFYAIGIVRGDEHPFPATEKSKFNPLQQITYIGIMIGLVPLLIATGLCSLYPELLPGIKRWVLNIHFILAVCSIFFIAGHLYMCIIGGRTITETFKSMIDGYHRH